MEDDLATGFVCFLLFCDDLAAGFVCSSPDVVFFQLTQASLPHPVSGFQNVIADTSSLLLGLCHLFSKNSLSHGVSTVSGENSLVHPTVFLSRIFHSHFLTLSSSHQDSYLGSSLSKPGFLSINSQLCLQSHTICFFFFFSFTRCFLGCSREYTAPFRVSPGAPGNLDNKILPNQLKLHQSIPPPSLANCRKITKIEDTCLSILGQHKDDGHSRTFHVIVYCTWYQCSRAIEELLPSFRLHCLSHSWPNLDHVINQLT